MNKKTISVLIASTALVTLAACSATRTQRAAGEQIDDGALLTSVKSALVSNPVTEAGEINVDVNRGDGEAVGLRPLAEGEVGCRRRRPLGGRREERAERHRHQQPGVDRR